MPPVHWPPPLRAAVWRNPAAWPRPRHAAARQVPAPSPAHGPTPPATAAAAVQGGGNAMHTAPRSARRAPPSGPPAAAQEARTVIVVPPLPCSYPNPCNLTISSCHHGGPGAGKGPSRGGACGKLHGRGADRGISYSAPSKRGGAGARRRSGASGEGAAGATAGGPGAGRARSRGAVPEARARGHALEQAGAQTLVQSVTQEGAHRGGGSDARRAFTLTAPSGQSARPPPAPAARS
jgi:hypothetical protein